MSHGVYHRFENGSFAELRFFHPVRLLGGRDGLISLEKSHDVLYLTPERSADILRVGLVISVLYYTPVADCLNERVGKKALRIFAAKQYAGHGGGNGSIFLLGQQGTFQQDRFRRVVGPGRVSSPERLGQVVHAGPRYRLFLESDQPRLAALLKQAGKIVRRHFSFRASLPAEIATGAFVNEEAARNLHLDHIPFGTRRIGKPQVR